MSDYAGPERRGVSTKMYDTVCRERFISNAKDLAEVRDDTQYLRRKIDNGLSSVPGDVKDLKLSMDNSIEGIHTALRKTLLYGILPVLFLIIGGAGFWLYSFGKLEAKISTHLVPGIEAPVNE